MIRLARYACLLTAIAGLAVACENGTPVQPGTSASARPSSPSLRSAGPVAFVSDRDGLRAIYLANADGSAVTRLTSGDRPTWAPDGRQLAFEDNRTIYVINVDGSGLRPLGMGIQPAWSPDGSRIAFASTDGRMILTVSPGGNDTAVLVTRDMVSPGSDDFGALSPSWSPDGGAIAFARPSWEEVGQIYLANIDGSGLRPLIDSAERYYQSEPSWSPDGTSIAFLTVGGVGIGRADGSGWGSGMPTWATLNSASMSAVSNPDWTPDGRLMFDQPTSADGRTHRRIFVDDHGEGRQLIPDDGAGHYSDWNAVWAR